MLGGRASRRIDVLLLQLQLGGVFDRDDALRRRDEPRQHVEHRRLTGAGAAGDEDVEPPSHGGAPGSARDRVGSVPMAMRSLDTERVAANLRMVRIEPSSDSGGMMTLTREPSGRRASTIGDASSMRRPTARRCAR